MAQQLSDYRVMRLPARAQAPESTRLRRPGQLVPYKRRKVSNSLGREVGIRFFEAVGR